MSTLRVLFVAANPTNTTPLRLGAELRGVREKLERSAERASIELSSAFATRPDDLLDLMNRHRPHILHFSGHGEGNGEIALESDAGTTAAVSPRALRALFQAFRPELQVVVLNACHSASQAQAFAEVVDAVIGMNNEIGDEASIVFAAGFYGALGYGRSIAEAFRQAKIALLLRGIREAEIPQLLNRVGVDPATLSLATSATLLRTQDPNVPERLRALLQLGAPLVQVPGRADGGPLVFFELALRHAETTFVVEAQSRTRIEFVASYLARALVGDDESDAYEWTLIAKTGAGGDDRLLRGHLTVEMAGIRSGDIVLLYGNHKEPEWAPCME